MKKLLATILLSILLLGSLSAVTFADTINITGVNMTVNYYENISNAFYMYYHPKEPKSTQCWASTEISVANDMHGYAMVNIKGIDESSNSSSTGEILGNYIKTDAAIINISYAKRHRHSGFRKLHGTFLGEWDYTVS